MTGKKSRPTHIRTVWFRLSLPMIICVASFMLYPFVYSLVLSFYSHKGLASSFVGAGNYVKMFHDPTFVKALGNNLLFLAIQVPLMLVLALFLAYLLETKDLKWVGFYRTALFLPCVTSLVAYSLVFRTMFQFDGLVNRLLQAMGFISAPLPWFTSRALARAVVILALCWRWTGYNMMYYIAGLQNISKELTEAAMIDGCSRLNAFIRIVIPQLKPVIVFTSVTSTIGTLQLFDEITMLTEGGPGNGTMTVSYYIYKQSFELNNNYGYSAAMSWVIVAIVALLSLIQLRVTREE